MTRTSTYLDYNATAPIRVEAMDRFVEVLRDGGNPSSIHGEGRRAKRIVEEARRDIAECLGAAAEMVTFTSGGTEANNLALKGCVQRNGIASILVSASEHPSVLQTAEDTSAEVHEIFVDADGRIDLGHLEKLASKHGGAIVSLMLANNETGVVQPVREAAAIAHAHGCLMHTDAVQAAGKIEVNFSGLDTDFMSLSAHKVGGPQGVGVLVSRPGIEFAAQITGGGQELKRRGGTENVAGIAGFAAALKAASRDLVKFEALGQQRDRLEREVKLLDAGMHVFGGGAERLANTSCFAVPGITAELALITLDLEQVSVSSGSACSSGKVSYSHVLRAMQVESELAQCAIRVSFGWGSTAADADRFLDVWKKIARPPAAAGVAAE